MIALNDYLYNMTASKKRLIILTKLDLADKEVALTWVDYFSKNGNQVILANLNDKNVVQEITKRIQILGSEKQEKAKRRGMKPQPIKTMIIGIPNIDNLSKSLLIVFVDTLKISARLLIVTLELFLNK